MGNKCRGGAQKRRKRMLTERNPERRQRVPYSRNEYDTGRALPQGCALRSSHLAACRELATLLAPALDGLAVSQGLLFSTTRTYVYAGRSASKCMLFKRYS